MNSAAGMRDQHFTCITRIEKAGGVQRCWRRTSATGTLLAALLLSACGGGDPTPTPLPERVSIQAPAQVEADAAVAFDASLDKDASGLSRRWSFGDGQTSTEAAPRHRYAQPGRYEVVLDIVNEAGSTRSARAEVLVGRFSIVEGLGCSGAQGTGWCLQWPQEARYNELLIQNATIGWSVGQDGQLYRTDETDATWRRVDMGLPLRRLYDLKFADDQTGWALGVADDPPNHIGSRGVLLAKTTDGGRTWKRHTLPEGWTIADVETAELQVLDPRRVLAVAGGIKLDTSLPNMRPNLVSGDGGERWALAWHKNLLFAKTGTSAWLQATNAAKVPVLYRSVDLGVSLIQSGPELVLPRAPFDDFQFVDDLSGWLTPGPGRGFGTEYYSSWATTDGGASWFRSEPSILPSTSEPPYPGRAKLVMLDRRNGYRTTDRRTIIGLIPGMSFSSTVDGGLTWSPYRSEGCRTSTFHDPTPQVGFHHISGTEFWKKSFACPGTTTEGPPIELSGDMGRTWRPLVLPDEALQPWGLTLRRDHDGALRLGTFHEGFRRYKDPGFTFRSTDEGASWQKIKTWPAVAPFERSSRQNSVAFRSSTFGTVVAYNVRLLTEDAGKTWRPEKEPNIDYCCSENDPRRAEFRGRMQFVGNKLLLMLGHDLWSFENADEALRIASSSDVSSSEFGPFVDLQFVDPQVAFALTIQRVSLLSRDPTSSWLMSTSDGGQTAWASAKLDGLIGLALHFIDRQRGLVVGKAGAIIQTTDGGRTWTPRASGTTEDLHAVRHVSESVVVAVGARGTVLTSRDGGTSWQRAALDTAFDWQRVHFADTRHGWIVGDFGSVAHTRDGGQTWQMQRSATGEHLVDVFALDAGTAWVVSDRGRIFATASGGR